MASLQIRNLKKIYHLSEKTNKEKPYLKFFGKNKKNKVEDTIAVDNFNLSVRDEEFVVIVGPSGCGKSTVLRVIAGLEEITEGEILINGKLMNDCECRERNVAMVFQNYALYPHMTCYENISFSLKINHLSKEEIDKKVNEVADMLDIKEYLFRKPKELSGGQRQRIAIGRAIVRNPDVFLMDEPLSNLDTKLRNQMRSELIKLHRQLKSTFIYVTHDQTEAMTLGDRIVVMNKGKIQQVGTPYEVFNRPRNLFVAEFIGAPKINTVETELKIKETSYYISIFGHDILLPNDKQVSLRKNMVSSGKIIVGIRPENIQIKNNEFNAIIDIIEMMGSTIYLHISINNLEFSMTVPSTDITEKYKIGDSISISIDYNRIHLFDYFSKENIELDIPNNQ